MNEQLLSIPVLAYQTEMVQCLAGVQPWGHARFSAVTTARHWLPGQAQAESWRLSGEPEEFLKWSELNE